MFTERPKLAWVCKKIKRRCGKNTSWYVSIKPKANSTSWDIIIALMNPKVRLVFLIAEGPFKKHKVKLGAECDPLD